MPIRKFREGEDARPAWTGPPGHPDLIRRIRAVWAIAARLAPSNFPRGVRKYRTMEEANREREEWDVRRCGEMRERYKDSNR